MVRKKRRSRGRSASRKTVARRGWFRRLLPYLFLLACVSLAALAFYALHLDREVRAKFEGHRWTLPAKVFASPTELYAGLNHSRADIVAALKRQGYSERDSIDEQGTYHVSGDQLDIHVRAFKFWDGDRPDRKIRLTFKGGSVSGFSAIDGKGKLALIRLDPLLIGSIYPNNKGADRILVKLSDVPKMLPAGLIEVENRHFMTDWGVEPEAILRAALADLRAGHIVQGGSTITQQLVKNFYLTNRQTIGRKLKEALMAILLDAHYSKKDILQAYINEVYLGQDGNRSIHGFGLASYFYFQKPLSELQPQQIALLVAMVKGPSYYDPRTHPKRARRRRDLVLDMFHKAGIIDTTAWKKAKSAPLGVRAQSVRDTSQYPAFIDLVRRQLHGQYKDSDLTRKGLRIFTTLNPAIQSATEANVDQSLSHVERAHGIKKDSLESAAVVTSVEGGRVLALVGGRNAGYAGFNRALDARRPIGSMMKPVEYLAALSQPSKYNVITPLDDSPLAVKQPNGKIWRPQNYSHHSHGTAVPMYYALEHSYNLASSRLALSVGIPNVIDMLKKLGYPGNPLAVPSLALGAVDMSPFEVAQIYNTLAGGGYYTPLTAIRDVTTRQGKPLNRYPLKLHQVARAAPVYLDTWMMERVARHGTGASMYDVLPKNLDVAGKTGTSNNLRDSWFAGFAANRVVVVWVGRDDEKSADLTGAAGALQLWSHIMANIDPRGLQNTPPQNVVEIPLRMEFDPSAPDNGRPQSGGLYDYGKSCGNATKVPFIRGYVPKGLSACDSDIMAADTAGHGNEGSKGRTQQKDKGNWIQRLFR